MKKKYWKMKLRETRNDHQIATAKRIKGLDGIAVAMDEHELVDKLNDINLSATREPLATSASPDLLNKIRTFIHE